MLRARVFVRGERGDRNGHRGVRARLEGHAGDAIPGQGGLERALADFLHVDERGQRDVRLDAAMLRALARDAIELADRDGELAADRALRPAVQRHEVLHGALAEGALAEDHAAVIVLDGAGEDLRRRGAEAVDQHGERAVVGGAPAPDRPAPRGAGRVLQLHDRALVDEQARERGGFRQIAAAVAAQVEHQAVDVLAPSAR